MDTKKKIDISLLKQSIVNKGFSIAEAAKRIGTEERSLSRKLEGAEEFRASDIYGLSEMLELSDDEKKTIFFND